MKLGLIARADNTGLGAQTWEFYRHMKPDKTLVVDISSLNHNPQFPERYPDGIFVRGFPTKGEIDEFLEGLDVVFIAESPYNYYLYDAAKKRGVKTAVQYNYEFFDWYSFPYFPTPDMLIAPSLWHFQEVQEFADQRGIKHIYLHCPVNRDLLPYRKIEQAKTFVHPVGKPAAHDRNGTMILLYSLVHVKSDITVKIKTLNERFVASAFEGDLNDFLNNVLPKNVNLIIDATDQPNYWEHYSEGDVMVLPRRYGGNCLPLNEGLSVGMPVIMTDLSPNNQFLPKSWLVPAPKIAEFKPRMVIDIHYAEPWELAQKIDEFASMKPTEMYRENIKANHLAQSISWEEMAPKYRAALEDLCSR